MVQSLKPGLSVVTANARHAGSLHRVVIDEPTRTVTAIVVERPLGESGKLLQAGRVGEAARRAGADRRGGRRG